MMPPAPTPGDRTSRLLCWLCAVAIGLGSGTAFAQDAPDPTGFTLHDLMEMTVDHVYGTSKFLQKVSDAPASVTIVSSDEIKLYGYRTLADVLRSVHGLSISYDRNYSYLGLRGLSRPGDYDSRILVLIDGHRMNDNIEDQAYLGNDFQLDLALVDRVEVVRGPGAAVYGSSAFSAVINVIMKQGHRYDGFEVSAGMASFDTRQARVTWGQRYASGLEWLASGSAYGSGGQTQLFFPEFDSPETSNGRAVNADAERSHRLALTASYKDVTVHAVNSGRTKHVPTGSFDSVFNDSRERTYDGRDFVDLQFAREIGREWDLIARAYWDRYAYTGWYPLDYGTEGISRVVVNRDDFLGTWWGAELDLSRRIGRQYLTVGTEFRNNLTQEQKNSDEGTAIVYLDDRRSSSAKAITVQDEIRLNRQILLNLAAREEQLTDGTIGFTPKLGVILTPRPGTTLKVLLSRALRAPSAYELFYLSPSNDGNVDLHAERIESFEVNAERYLTQSMRIGASVFANTYKDLIVGIAQPDGSVQLTNGLSAHARGMDLTWTAVLGRGVEARTSYSQQFDTDSASNAWTSGAPKHLAKLNLGGRIDRLALTTGLEVQYESARQTHTGDQLPSATVVNLTVVRAGIFKQLDLSASGFNLFNQRFSEPVSENHRQGAILQDGRQLTLALTWRFR